MVILPVIFLRAEMHIGIVCRSSLAERRYGPAALRVHQPVRSKTANLAFWLDLKSSVAGRMVPGVRRDDDVQVSFCKIWAMPTKALTIRLAPLLQQSAFQIMDVKSTQLKHLVDHIFLL